MFFNRKNKKIRKKKQEFAALFFPLALLLLLLKKKLDERSEMKENKNTNYPLFEVWTNLCETWEKKKTKTTAICLHNWKKILRRRKVWGMGGHGTGFCWLPRPHPSPNLAGHTHLHCLTSLSVSSCVGRARSENKVKRNTNKHE